MEKITTNKQTKPIVNELREILEKCKIRMGCTYSSFTVFLLVLKITNKCLVSRDLSIRWKVTLDLSKNLT